MSKSFTVSRVSLTHNRPSKQPLLFSHTMRHGIIIKLSYIVFTIERNEEMVLVYKCLKESKF